jgi:hypothetical protein
VAALRRERAEISQDGHRDAISDAPRGSQSAAAGIFVLAATATRRL